jgi:hypothetical protein
MSTATIAAAPPSSAGAAVSLDHLSWSGLKTYSNCPKKFFYHYVEHAPEEFVAASLAFGSAFHVAVDHVHQSMIEGASLPTIDTLLQKYDESWNTETARAPEVSFAKTDDKTSLHELAQRMLAAYLDHIAASGAGTSGARIIAIEHSHRFHLLADVPPIEMRLDLLELSGTDLIVSDVKTSRSRWNDQKIAESMPQLVLYATAMAALVKELGAKRIVPRFLVVTKAKSPIVQVLEPKAMQSDVDRLKHQVSDTWTAIQSGIFIQRESWQCAQCPYKRRCLGR